MIGPADVVNVPLLRHPMNWLIVWTVLLFAGYAWHLVMAHVDRAPAATA
jgi:hypothetical protein